MKTFLTFLLLFLFGTAVYAQPVHIPDPNLNALIRKELGLSADTPITELDMARLRELHAHGLGIKDLVGISFAVNLQELNIRDNPVENLYPLAPLKNLLYLNFESTNVSDISVVKFLTNLRVLHFNGINSSDLDLSPITELVHLERITCDRNGVTDISPMANLINPRSFRTWANPISDLSPLSELRNLEKVNICGADLEDADLSPLAGLTNVTELYLPENGISDISPLAQLTGLTRLDLHQNYVSDASLLVDMTNLKWVVFEGIGYAFSRKPIRIGDTFTYKILAEHIHELAGWQFDIAFDPDALEAIDLTEDDFLKAGGGSTFFQSGRIDNTAGRVTGISAARITGGGVSGGGPLLQVRFKAKSAGKTTIGLQNFLFGSDDGRSLSAAPLEMHFTVVNEVVDERLPGADVNGDGIVNILDLIRVARQLDQNVPANAPEDVNGDGVVDVLDLVFVANQF